MGITSALVLLAILWFLTLFIVLPIRFVSQGDDGKVVMGTPEGAPAHIDMRKKMRITTLIAVALWVPLCAIIMSGWITVDDFDLFTRFGGGLAPLE